MESLPDDVWYNILQIGIKTRRLDHTDLCSLAIVNRHFDQLTMDNSHWANLLSRDFPPYLSFQAPSKDLYREKYECAYVLISTYMEGIDARMICEQYLVPGTYTMLPDELKIMLNRINRLNFFSFVNLFDLSDFLGKPLFAPIQETQENSGHQSDLDNISVDGIGDVLSFHQQGDSVQSHVSQPIPREERKRYYENKPCKSSRPKVIPNSKSYVPMNRPPRRSMPRKI